MKTIMRRVTMGTMPIMLALSLALTAVGGTLAQEAHDTTATTGGTGGRGGDTLAISASSLTLMNDLRGKLLRITVSDDGTY